MKLNFTAALTVLKSTGIVVLLSALSIGKTQAQCGYAVGLGCDGTDYTNFGLQSNNTPATIEYDNFISGFHSSVIRSGNGKYYIWGQSTQNSGTGNNLTKQELTVNYPTLAGKTILKTAMATGSNGSVTSVIVLTTDGLYAAGTRGSNHVFGTNVLPNNTAFSKITQNNNATWTYGLPHGIHPTQVKMMFATYQTLAIVTCDGQGWVMSQNSNMRGNGASGASNAWHRVQTNSSTNLNDIIAIRGTNQALFALTQASTGAQNLYTWGSTTRVIGGNQTSRSYATLVTKPKATGSIKMIGATYNGLSSGNNEAGVTYYVLYTDGELYSMGNNSVRQLGNWANTTSHTSQWVQPSYPNATNSGPGTAMTNIKWISPNEHDNFGNACINVINADGELWNWGTNSANMLGRVTSGASNTVGNAPHNPGQPHASNPLTPQGNYTPAPDPDASVILAVETGGHTTLQITQCEEKFGYIGHVINGSDASGNQGGLNVFHNRYTYTADVDVCGADAVAAINTVIEPLTGANQRVCAGQTIYLAPVPPGGSLTIIANTAGAVLTGNALTFNNTTGSVTLQYQVTTTCGPQTVTRIFEIENCPLQYITGTVWVDNNKNAVKDGMEHGSNASSSSNGGLWATLVNDDGEVVASVPVNTDGTYSIPQNTSTVGNFTVTITNAQVGGGTTIPNSATSLPPTWVYTGNNPASNIPCLVPACTDPGNISVTLSGTGSSDNDFGINGVYTVTGKVFHDPNGLNGSTPAVDGTDIYNATTPSAYQTQNHPQLYVSVIDVASGKLIQYVPVKPDGTYEVDVPLDQNVILRLTTTPGTVGQTATAPTLPNGWNNVGEAFGINNSEGTNNNDGTGTGSNAPLTRYDGDVHLSFANNTLPASDLNFGIQQPPVADPKEYHVANGYFGSTAGFPPITGYKAIPMSSAGLVESTNNSNGSLSGQDSEDCPSANCNGNGGSNILSTFTIGIINTNTKLYYDFGAGPVEVFNNTAIENFDITKMAIYGAIGQGASGNELGFTYALMDKAGITSPFVSYLITTIEALPLQLLDFTGYAASFTSVLNWNTAKEENVSHFEIMRSTDGRKWNEIGQVKALNNPINNSYNFIDQKPQRGVNYYKLFMKDIDATGSYSKIISVKHDQIAQQIIVGPNPVKDKLTIDFKGFEQQTSVLMTMYNSNGSIVWPQSVYTSTAPITMDIAQFASGVYIIEIKTDTDTFIEKIVKH